MRGPDGDGVEVASGPKPTRGRLATIPFLRGPLRLAEALLVVPLARIRLPTARLPLEDPRVLSAAFSRRRLRAPPPARWRSGERQPRAHRRRSGCSRRWPPSTTATSRRTTGPSTRRSAPTNPEAPRRVRQRCGSNRNLIRPLLAVRIAGQVIIQGALERPELDRPRSRLAGDRRRRGGLRLRRAQSGGGGLAGGPWDRVRIQRLISTREPACRSSSRSARPP